MEARQLISVSVTKGDQVFTFHIPVGTTWGNAVDAAYEILQEVGNMAKKSMEQAKSVLTEAEEPASNDVPLEPTIVEGDINGNQ